MGRAAISIRVWGAAMETSASSRIRAVCGYAWIAEHGPAGRGGSAAAVGTGSAGFFSAQVVPRTSILPPALRNAARSEAIESLLTTVLAAAPLRSLRMLLLAFAGVFALRGMVAPVRWKGRKRPGVGLAQVVLPLAAAVIAAHRKLAADRRALRIDRAAQVIGIDRRAPAFLVARHHGTAVGVA